MRILENEQYWTQRAAEDYAAVILRRIKEFTNGK